jgi:hypothetical protein
MYSRRDEAKAGFSQFMRQTNKSALLLLFRRLNWNIPAMHCCVTHLRPFSRPF